MLNGGFSWFIFTLSFKNIPRAFLPSFWFCVADINKIRIKCNVNYMIMKQETVKKNYTLKLDIKIINALLSVVLRMMIIIR